MGNLNSLDYISATQIYRRINHGQQLRINGIWLTNELIFFKFLSVLFVKLKYLIVLEWFQSLKVISKAIYITGLLIAIKLEFKSGSSASKFLWVWRNHTIIIINICYVGFNIDH